MSKLISYLTSTLAGLTMSMGVAQTTLAETINQEAYKSQIVEEIGKLDPWVSNFIDLDYSNGHDKSHVTFNIMPRRDFYSSDRRYCSSSAALYYPGFRVIVLPYFAVIKVHSFQKFMTKFC